MNELLNATTDSFYLSRVLVRETPSLDEAGSPLLYENLTKA
jgi:hypothetical protein